MAFSERLARLAAVAGLITPAPPQLQIAATGEPVPAMAAFDTLIGSLMRRYAMPGAGLAVVKDGRLVYARGFGWADVDARVPVLPTSRFRIASLSKPITSAAIMRLVEDGKLKLSDRAFEYLRDLSPPRGATRDPRLDRITIEMLLQHTGGWNREQAFDPMFIPRRAADAVGAPAPATAETVIRYMLGQPLQHDPGTTYSYSNFGYAVLGRIIERVTGESYSGYVHRAILDPAGASRMQLGRTRLDDRADDEVRYYAANRTATVASVFPPGARVSSPYGSWHLEAMDAHGGWIASVVDYARFVSVVDGRATPPDVLRPASVQRMVARPAHVNARLPTWYANGWSVRPTERDANWWHNGGLSGTATLVVRGYDGTAWVAFFNASPNDPAFGLALDQGLWQAARAVRRWPDHDLFARYR
jgi:CubicO group peptidase (beta-lactamase class C family)